jgi:hypothetical protein
MEEWAEESFISTALQKARYENFVFKAQNNKFVPHSTVILKEGELYQGVLYLRNSKQNTQHAIRLHFTVVMPEKYCRFIGLTRRFKHDKPK